MGTDEPGGTIPAGPPNDRGLRSPSSPERDGTTRWPRTRGAVRLRPRARSGSPTRRWVRRALVLADTGAILLAMTMAGSWSAAAWAYGGAALISLGVSGAYRPRICLQALPELPPGQMGNSEVGHLNLGAGAIVPQDLARIDAAQGGVRDTVPIGMDRLPRALADALRGRIRYGVQVAGIANRPDGVTVTFTDGGEAREIAAALRARLGSSRKR